MNFFERSRTQSHRTFAVIQNSPTVLPTWGFTTRANKGKEAALRDPLEPSYATGRARMDTPTTCDIQQLLNVDAADAYFSLHCHDSVDTLIQTTLCLLADRVTSDSAAYSADTPLPWDRWIDLLAEMARLAGVSAGEERNVAAAISAAVFGAIPWSSTVPETAEHALQREEMSGMYRWAAQLKIGAGGGDGRVTEAAHAAHRSQMWKLFVRVAKYRQYRHRWGLDHGLGVWTWQCHARLHSQSAMTLPCELRLFTLLLGWVNPLCAEHDPHLIYWLAKDLWAVATSPGAASTYTCSSYDDYRGHGLLGLGDGFCDVADDDWLVVVGLNGQLYTTLSDCHHDDADDAGAASFSLTCPKRSLAAAMCDYLAWLDVPREEP